jgi:hypothetical protein
MSRCCINNVPCHCFNNVDEEEDQGIRKTLVVKCPGQDPGDSVSKCEKRTCCTGKIRGKKGCRNSSTAERET